MELEEMKSLWGEMSADMEKQKKITGSLIIKMTKAGYSNKISKIFVPEAAGSLISLAGIVFVLFNFQQLNTWYLLTCGIAAILILLVLPIMSLTAVCKMRSLHITGNNYKQSLEEYAKAKIQFVFVQKLSFYLGPVLMLVTLPVMGKLMGGKDFFAAGRLWFWFALAFPFYYYFAKWVFKCYIKSANDAENILKELKE